VKKKMVARDMNKMNVKQKADLAIVVDHLSCPINVFSQLILHVSCQHYALAVLKR